MIAHEHPAAPGDPEDERLSAAREQLRRIAEDLTLLEEGYRAALTSEDLACMRTARGLINSVLEHHAD